jgi:polysaccharide export outer membrane protein
MASVRVGPCSWLLLTALFLSPLACYAQSEPTQDLSLKPNPIATLQAFEPPANQPYELGRGDAITVDAIGRPEISGKHIIGPDGSITLPIVGSVQIADKTREEASATIQHALSPYYSDIVVSISVDQYTSNQILLLGAVEHPGILTFDKTPTLLEVISRGGALPESTTTGGGAPGPKPAGIPEECMIYRGNDTMVTVELKALLDAGSPLANMRLRRDDIVYVTGRTRYVSVLGQVNHPGNLRLESSSTLADLLTEAGGPTEKAGRSPSIEIIHTVGSPSSAKTQIVPFKSLLAQNSLDVTLKSGDIIYVPESGFNGFAYTFEKLAPLVNLFTVASLLNQQ